MINSDDYIKDYSQTLNEKELTVSKLLSKRYNSYCYSMQDIGNTAIYYIITDIDSTV